MTKLEKAQGLSLEINIANEMGNTKKSSFLNKEREKIIKSLSRKQQDIFYDWLEEQNW